MEEDLLPLEMEDLNEELGPVLIEVKRKKEPPGKMKSTKRSTVDGPENNYKLKEEVIAKLKENNILIDSLADVELRARRLENQKKIRTAGGNTECLANFVTLFLE